MLPPCCRMLACFDACIRGFINLILFVSHCESRHAWVAAVPQIKCVLRLCSFEAPAGLGKHVLSGISGQKAVDLSKIDSQTQWKLRARWLPIVPTIPSYMYGYQVPYHARETEYLIEPRLRIFNVYGGMGGHRGRKQPPRK
ncbi:unnamed protein product [Durusdinium trenchii]|uniref:Uncharacterized protein n=1 Tax=Durusdinium trenchii TaxID=1381693 RepID=A0ABP0MBB3_9DINO